MQKNEQTLYEILGVAPNATLAEIKIAYRNACKKYHPDVNHDADVKTCNEMMVKINNAYSILRDEKSRMEYDQMLNAIGYYDNSNDKPGSGAQANAKESESDRNVPSHRSINNEELYRYYNSVDFDENAEEEFINYMRAFANNYISYICEYYKKYQQASSDDIIREIYESFEKNIRIKRKEKIRTN